MKTGFWGLMAGLFLVCGIAAAQQASDPAVFDYTLEKLHQSVADLSRENQDLKSQNADVRVKVNALTAKLASLKEDSNRLEEKRAAAMARDGGDGAMDVLKAQGARLDQELKKIGQESAGVDSQIKAAEEEESAWRQKISVLEADIKAVPADGALSAEWQASLAEIQAERDKFRKESDDVAARLKTAKAQWLQLESVIANEPKQFAVLEAEKDAAAKDLAAIEVELPKLKASAAAAQAEMDQLSQDDNSDLRVARIESEVQAITERNHSLEFEVLSRQKAGDEEFKRLQEARAAAEADHKDEIAAVSARNTALHQELDGLRKEMIALDKKKSALETDAYTPR